MKKGSFAGLLYREFYLARKSYIIGLIMFAAWALFGWLTLVSFKYGNIGKLMDYLAGGQAGTGEFDLEVLQQNMKNDVTDCPRLEWSGKDEFALWQRYAKCTPVTPARRAALKTLMNFIAAASAFVLSIGYISFIDALIGDSITYRELALLVTVISAVTLMSVVAQVYIRIFRGMDKGMLALVATVIVIEVIFIATNTPKPGSQDKEIDLIGLCELIFPFTPIIFVGTLAAGFGLMYALYRRREK